MKEQGINMHELLKIPLGQKVAGCLIDYIDEHSENKIMKQIEAKIMHLATKEDLGKVRNEIAEVKAELIKWMFIFISGQTALIIALMKLL